MAMHVFERKGVLRARTGDLMRSPDSESGRLSLVPARACLGFQCSSISGSLQGCHMTYQKMYNFWLSIYRKHLHGLSVQRFFETYPLIAS